MITLSYIQARKLLEALRERKTALELSLDLDKTKSTVTLSGKSVMLPDDQSIRIKDIEKIGENDNVCFLIQGNKPIKIQLFGEDTQKMYKLLPTESWPTVEISGVRMHRVVNVNPRKDTEMKLRAIHPVYGRVLDTCCGLGYTTIMAAQAAGSTEVITHERDPNVLEIARHNPWSWELFLNKKIKLVQADVMDEIKKYPDEHFDRIIHDPPRVGLSGELYSLDFYQQLYRVLRKGGKLYHYTGDPGKVTRGNDVAGGAMQRLTQAGFANVKRKRFLLGVVAIKNGLKGSYSLLYSKV